MLKWFLRIHNKSLLIYVCLLVLVACIPPVYAKQTEPKLNINRSASPFVIVSIDGLSFRDIAATKMPNLFQISKTSAYGLISINTGDDRSSIPTYLSTGSGTKLSGTWLAGWNGNPNETIQLPFEPYPLTMGQLFQRWTGATTDKSIVVPDITEIQNRANTSRWGSHVGFLGDRLHENGLRTAAIGNADFADQHARLGPLFVMDHQGTVDAGDVSEQTLITDSLRPNGVRIDQQRMLSATMHALSTSDVIMIQWGDLNRLDSTYPYLQARNYQTLRSQELKEADIFIGMIQPLIQQKRGSLMIAAISPLRDSKTGENRYLSPLLITGSNVVPHTFLTSTTTHDQGLVSNLDIAPSIVHWMTQKQHQNESLLGHQIKSGIPSNQDASIAMRKLQEMEEDLTVLYHIRASVLSVFVHMAEYLLLTLLILFIWKRAWLRYGKWVLEIIATAPLAMLLSPVLHPHSANSYISNMLLIQFALIVLMQFLGNQQRRCIWICFATSASIVFDIVFQHAAWMKQSVLGYDLITGARYYGIGNECMGVWLGCTLTGLLLLSVEQKSLTNHRSHIRTKAFGIIKLMIAISVIYLLASPRYGANAGGALAAMVGFLMLWLKSQNVSFWSGLSLSFVVVGGLGTLMLLGLNLLSDKDDTTHISEAGKLLIQGEGTKIWDIIARKISMNVHLLQVSMWGTLLWVTIAVLFGWWWVNRRAIGVKTIQAMQAILGCVIAAFACNDSGVLAAAAILLYVCIGLFAQEMDAIRTSQQQEFDWVDQQV